MASILRRFAVAFLLTLSVIAHHRAVADDAAKLDSQQLLDLMFPPGSQFNALPVVRWFHPPHIRIIIDNSVSPADAESAKRIVADVSAQSGAYSKGDVEWRLSADEVRDEDVEADFILVIAADAVSQSNLRYKRILRLGVANDLDAQQVSDLAAANMRDTITRFGYLTTGRENRFISFVNSDADDPKMLPALMSVAMLTGLSPSLAANGNVARLLQNGEKGQEISMAGYQYLHALYDPSVTIGMHRADVGQRLH